MVAKNNKFSELNLCIFSVFCPSIVKFIRYVASENFYDH